MTAYIVISDPETDPDAPLTSELAKKWRDNPLAMFEGDASASAVRLQFAAMGGWYSTAGMIGSYAFLQANPAATLNPNATRAGANLLYAGATGGVGGAPAGTWRLMGQTLNSSLAASTSLWVRIS